MHIASRVLFFIVQPSHLAMLLVGAGLALLLLRPAAARLGKGLAAAGFALLLVLGFSPIGHALLLPLEERFPPSPLPPGPFAGIILLGGFEDPSVSRARGALMLNESAERLTETVLLARQLPQARVVFTGGAADLLLPGRSAAPAVATFLEAAGIAPDRIVLEGKSRNTYENATLVRDLIEPRPGERWLLVTSAWHMPRAIGAFRQAGLNVVAWPADYRTRGAEDLSWPFDTMTEGLRRTDMAVREWVGLIAYRLLGRSDALFPAPWSPDGTGG